MARGTQYLTGGVSVRPCTAPALRRPRYHHEMTTPSRYNPRRKNGTLRNKHRARLKALGLPCAICGGIIHYDEPSDSDHPLSFVVDEKLPVSRWQEFGYSSPEQAAQDWNNLQATHYICNARKKNKTMMEVRQAGLGHRNFTTNNCTVDNRAVPAWKSDGLW